MLKRLYVHNYKCLVNFEINFDKDISLFLGANGSGKSTVFEVLAKLRRVIVGEEKVENVFDERDFPRWLNLPPPGKTEIHFELDIEIDTYPFQYQLILELDNFTSEIYVKEENLLWKNEQCLRSKDNTTTDLIRNLEYPFDNSRSNVSRHFSDLVFLKYIRSIVIARIKPSEMTPIISKANSEVRNDFSNYSEWFAHLNEKNRRGVSAFEQAMRETLLGFDYFRIEQSGQAKVLMVDFENPTNKRELISYYFNELSDGQKVLIALYALIYCAPENSLICIDEPENFLALPEIQPWLNVLREQCQERNIQALLISHHPSLINFLAAYSGFWFSRKENHTRFEKITKQDDDGLSLAQLIEMGWIYGD